MTTFPPCRAVITGIGCVSPFGVGGHDFVADVLRANRSAIHPITGFATTGLRCHLGAEVSPEHLPLTEEARRWSRLSQMTVLACRQAVADARLSGGATLSAMGLVVGSELGDLRSTEAFHAGFLRKGPVGLSALLFPSTVMNAMAGTVSIALGIQGPMLTLNQWGVAGEVAVARAVALLRAGRAAAVLVCGVDELFPTLYETLALLKLPAPRDGRDEACRPFDQRHNGPVFGEGATAVVLETPEHARARGATTLAEVCGVGWGGLQAAPYRYPTPRQIQPSILEHALREAAVATAAVEVAYLSGSGDAHHDRAELALMQATFGMEGPLLTSVTHLTGEYGSLGAFRTAAATMTVAQGVMPRLDYLQQPISPPARFATQALAQRPSIVLVHGLARGGTQVALLLRRPSA